jgi:hypothetical protein
MAERMEIVKLLAVGGTVFGCGYCDAEADFFFRAGRWGHKLEDGIDGAIGHGEKGWEMNYEGADFDFFEIAVKMASS